MKRIGTPRAALAGLLAVAALPACAHARPAFAAAAPCEAAAVVAQADRALALAHQKKYDDAVGEADGVLGDCPTQPVAVAALGEALFGQDKLDAAIARMDAALKARSDLAYAYYWRGKAWNAKKQPARMVDDFEAFLKLAPNAPEAAAVKQLLSALR